MEVNIEALFLMAPTLYLDVYKKQIHGSNNLYIEIVHGWLDKLILLDHSFKFATDGRCHLHLIPGDLSLNGSLERVSNVFEQFSMMYWLIGS